MGFDSQMLTIRSLVPDDRVELAKLAGRVSPESAISRFHGALTRLSEPLLDRLLDLEPGQREAVIAEDEEGIIGVARFFRDSPESSIAEIAVLVADRWQHHGVGHRLLAALIDRANRVGITAFRADMLATNTTARRLVAEIGQVVASSIEDGHVVLTVDISPTSAAT